MSSEKWSNVAVVVIVVVVVVVVAVAVAVAVCASINPCNLLLDGGIVVSCAVGPL